jgi:hypothetical protein
MQSFWAGWLVARVQHKFFPTRVGVLVKEAWAAHFIHLTGV